jgi:transposase
MAFLIHADSAGEAQLQRNWAIHTIAATRMRCCSSTQAYLARRKAEGNSDKEIMRCLKRSITHLFRTLSAAMAVATQA